MHEHSNIVTYGWLATIMLVEQFAGFFEHAPATQGRFHRCCGNIAFGVINKSVLVALMLPLLVWCENIDLWTRPAWMGGWGGLLIDIMVLDLVGYWFHRLSHVIPVLWRFHQIHHLDEQMDATTGLRVHTFERLINNLLKFGTIVLLNVPVAHFAIYETVALIIALFHHGNIHLPSPLQKVIGLVFTTPQFHWVHHHDEQKDTDSNYGFILVWWDALFGSYNSAIRTKDWRMGLDYSVDLPWLELVWTPFHPVKLKYRAKKPVSRGLQQEGPQEG